MTREEGEVVPPASAGANAAACGASAVQRRSYLSRLRHDLLGSLEAIEQIAGEILTAAQDRPPEFTDEMRAIKEHAAAVAEKLPAMLETVKPDAGAEFTNRLGKVFHDLKNQLAAIGYRCEDLLDDADRLANFPEPLTEIAAEYRRCLLKLRLGDDSPMAQDFSAGARPAPQSVPGSAATPPHLVGAWLSEARHEEPGTVLVVEDQQIHRDRLTQLLKSQGHTVLLTSNGADALALLDEQPVDLVLLDIYMEGMNGYQVLGKLKRDPELRAVPVVMISAVDDIDSVAHCINLGADDYLFKPFDVRLLKARVSACLARSRMQKERLSQIEEIDRQRNRADGLLYRLFPPSVVQELLATSDVNPERVSPRRHYDAAVMFCDVAGFTAFCDSRDPREVIDLLRILFAEYERIAEAHHVQKIKTIGDCFMSAGGLASIRENPVLDCLEAAEEMVAAAPRLCQWQVRVCIHSGPVVVGLAGQRQFCYDMWGDTVNLASRVQNEAEPGKIVLTEKSFRKVSNRCRGEIDTVELKNRGWVDIVRFERFKAPR